MSEEKSLDSEFTEINQIDEQIYPGVSERVKAAIVDGIFLVVMIIVVTLLFDSMNYEGETGRIIAFVCVFILYDPLLISLAGATLGHLAFGIRVKRQKDQSKNIILPLAIIRYVLKALLGVISLITVGMNPMRLAIHDSAVGSVVVFKKKKED